MPATIQSVLAARIDRLSPADKSVLNAAAIIGSTFDLDVLHAVLPDAADRNLEALITAELIDRVQLPSAPRYAFRHPLVRAVAYESQLAATRAAGHRRLAAVIAMREPSAVEQNSALIAQHLEAAGQGREAYQWYMRSGEWLRPRDLVAARVSWERARVIADGLTAQHDEPLADCCSRSADVDSMAGRWVG